MNQSIDRDTQRPHAFYIMNANRHFLLRCLLAFLPVGFVPLFSVNISKGTCFQRVLSDEYVEGKSFIILMWLVMIII